MRGIIKYLKEKRTKAGASNKRSSTRPNPVYELIDDEPLFYRCTRCPRKYKRQKGNFLASPSPIYKNNNGYVPICKHCTEELFDHYMAVCGSEYEAIRRLCMKLDLYYADTVVDSAKKRATERGWMAAYVSILNLSQQKDKTYDNTIDEEKTVVIESMDDVYAAEDISVSEAAIKRWGLGFTPDEYKALDSHYKMLTQKIENLDFIQETLIRDLCTIKVQQVRAMQKSDVDKYEKLTKLYQSTLSNAQLKVSNSQLNNTNDCYGVWLKEIESYCPSEFYQDKDIYKDYFHIGEYLERFIYRPLKNLLTGSKDNDEEFVINNEDTR